MDLNILSENMHERKLFSASFLPQNHNCPWLYIVRSLCLALVNALSFHGGPTSALRDSILILYLEVHSDLPKPKKWVSINKRTELDRMIALLPFSSTYCSLVWVLIWNIIEKVKGGLIIFIKSLRWGVFLAGLKKPMPHQMFYTWAPVSLCQLLLLRSSFSCSVWPKITSGSHVPGGSKWLKRYLIVWLLWRLQFRGMLKNNSQVHLNALASWINFQAVLWVLKETSYLKEVFAARLLDGWGSQGSSAIVGESLWKNPSMLASC